MNLDKVDHDYQELKDEIATAQCELCERDWYEDELWEDELDAELESIKSTGRCVGCYGEYGDEYPDRI